MRSAVGPPSVNTLALLLLVAGSGCRDQGVSPPRVDAVSPSQAPSTTPVALEITGTAFHARLTSDLETGNLRTEAGFDCQLEHQSLDVRVSIEDVSWIDPTRITGTVPSAIPLGTYDLTVVGPHGASNTLVDAYEVCADLDGDGVCGGVTPDPWAPTLDTWQYRKRIVVPSRAPETALTDFPLLISLVDTDLRDRALENGFDIVFTDDAGAPLAQQHERYEAASGTLISWVALPSLDTAVDTTLFMYYGGPSASPDPSTTAVWSNGFVGVWHLDEAGAGIGAEYTDASGSGHDATGGGGSAASVPNRVAGLIGRGQDFDGADDFVTTSTSLLNGLSAFTLSMWAHVRSVDNTVRPGLIGQNDVLEIGFFWNDRLNVWAEAMTVDCPGKNLISLCTPDFPLASWFHLAVVWDGVEIALFLDGEEKHRIALATLGTSAFGFDVGGNVFDSTGNNLDGMVDEVRVASTPRSPEWIAVEHANQAEPASFLSVGPEEARP